MEKPGQLLKFIAAMVIFGTNGIFVAKISLGSAQIVLLRTLFGALFLLAIVLVKRSFSFSELKADLLPATIGGAALGLNWVLLFSAYRAAGVGLSTLIYYCGPILVLALSPILFKEKLTWNKLLALAAVAVGMFCITGNIELGSRLSSGLLCGGGAALFYAVIIVAGKRIKHLSGLNCALYELAVSFAVVLAYLIISGAELPVIPQKNELVYIFMLGFVNTGLAYYLYFSGLQNLSGQTVSIICYIDPLTALLVSVVFLNEVLVPLQTVGAVLILGGAILGEFSLNKRK